MIGKNNQYLKKTKEGTKVETYSIKKFKVGTASVVIGASIFFGAGAVAQASEDVSKNTTTDNSKDEGATLGGAVSEKTVAKPVVKEATKEEVAAGVAAKLGVKETEKEVAKEPVKTLDKTQLSSFISEIEGKISSGAYANKTEESVASLVADLNAAKATLESAKTQEELTKTYQKLVVSVNSKLRNKTVEKKETPVVESTTSKETAGNKEENTEKKVETNSIENTGAKDPRNGKEIAKNTAFRAAVNQDPKVDFTFSIPDEKKIYIYNEEHFSLEIPVYSETGKIRYATIKKGSRQRFPNVAGTDNDLDVEFGFTATVINRDETAGVTSNASQANPAKIVITGRPNDILKNMPQYTKQENQTLNVGTRYVQVVDDQGRENLKKGMDITDPGYFYLVLKSQAKKYALRSQGTDEKISVSSLTNPTAEDLKKIKDSIQLEYSTTNEDARFADKRGTLVEHPEDVIQSVNIVGNNIVVTFTDGSTKTKPVGEIVQKNIPPVVNLPYSNEANRNIYIYSGEETDLTFTATDESKIKDLKLRGPGDINYNNATSFGLAVGNIVDSAVTSGQGSVSEDKKTATIKMTGTTNLGDGKKWTSVIVAKDDNNGESAPFNGRINATTNPAERQKIAGYVEFVVKNQTSKYDIKALEGKVSVVDPANVTAEEFEKIKEKVKIEYSQTNDDANFTSKRGQAVDNQATRISTITKDASGNLVVTYKDGSTDTKPLSEYVSLNKQPAIDAINTAANNKIAEINSNTNATAEEKAAAIEKVNADKTKALTAINDNSVMTKAALDNAKTSGTTAISNDNPVVTKKDTAKAAIDTALREKEAAIDANNTLTTEEKNAAKADAQAKANAAKTAIDNATTNAAVDSAKTAGTTSVGSVNPTAVAKPAAKKAIEDALNAKIAQLDGRNDLTTEEKNAAKADAQARATAAKAAIDNATTDTTVNSAKTTGVADVESVNPQASQKKSDAKNAVDEALKAKEAAIDANNDLTAEEKANAKEDAKAKADAAKQAIDNATTNDAVTQAKNDGATSVDSVNPTPVAKPAAKKAIDDALKAKNDAIDANNDLTDEEKTAAKADAKAKADAAKTAIDNATTNDAVTQAKNDGATSVDSVNPTPVVKPAAKKAIDDALKAKNDAIDANNDLTDEEKATAKQEAQAKATEAKNNIDAARTNDAVTQAKTNGTTEVNNVNPTPVAKPAAKKAVEDALAEKIKAIEANNNLTDEEKTAAKQEAQAKVTEAKNNIDAARTNDAVTQAKTNGTTEVNNVNPQPEAKPAAKKAVEDALADKIKAIDENNDLTDEEKTAAKQEAKAKADAAKQAVNKATTNADVENAKTTGVADVNSLNPVAVKKPEAKKAIDEALKVKEAEIDANNDLTAEEKQAAKEEAKKKADASKEAIDNATTNAEVEQAKANGTTEVKAVDPQPEAKTEAKKAIDDALKAKNDEISVRTDLTDEEKTAAKAEAKKKADAAKEAIDKATTNAEVEQAKTNGTSEVTSVNPQPEAKTEAKKAIDEALKAKNDAIDANNDLTDEEKTAAKEEAKAKADAAKTAIDNATTNAAVEQAKANGTTEVNNVNPTPVAKPAAKKAIDDALKAKNDAIDANNDLTDEEKAKAKEDAKAKADAAKTAIDNATTNAAVEQAKTDGATSVDSVNPTAQAKPAAKKAIDDALADKIKAIDANNDLTDEEKTAAKEEAKAKADAAKQAIDNATTNVAVDQAKANGTTEVNNVNPQPEAKTAAKKAVEDALADKIKAIDANNDLTDEEKTAAKEEAKAKADAAKQAIDNATTNAEVDQVKDNGTTEVKAVDPQSVAKPAAKKAIEDSLKAKNDAIDANNDLTDEEKATAKQEAQAKATEAKNNIDAARTNDAVTQAKTNGTTEVNNVNPTPVAKTAAKKAVEDALADKIKAIDANNDLTDEEKTAAKADAKAKADAAKEAIDNATTNAAVEQAKANGTTEVISVDPEAVAKTEAKKAIDEALKAKNDEIGARTDLTEEEKTAAKADAKVKADAAKAAINKATTNVEVDQAKTTGTTEVASVNPEALVKSAAKKAIDDKLAEQLKVIANTPDATDEEKKAVADKAKQLAEEVKKAIDAAKINADVKKLQADSEAKIEKTVPLVEDKPNARKAIDEEAKAKKAAIDARTDISDKVKELLKAEVDEIVTQAKKAIDAASSVNELNKIEEAKKSEIKAVEEVRVPAEKVIVADPTKLTDEEKAKVLAAIRSVNPDAKEITQDEKGNVVVVTANDHKQVISVAQVTKTQADLAKENAGNVVNTPVTKTAVADVTKLTEAEKQEIIAKVKAVNPGATVAIDEKGNVIVTNGEGLVFVLPVLDLVIPTDKLTDITANSKVNTPAIRTLVANKGSLTSEEIAKIKAAIEEINPRALVVVDEKGNATVTTKDGKSMTISSDVLVKDAADVADKNNGENINLDFDKELVADINNLTEADKEKVKFKVLGAIREAVELVIDEKGNATVILKDGRTFTILAKNIFEQRKKVTVNLPEKVKVKDVSNLTEIEKEAVKQALITTNPNLKDAKITISNTGEVTIVYPDGQVVVISAENLVVAEKVTSVIVEDNVGTYTKEDKKPMINYSNDNTPRFNAKKGQRLANTGEDETNTGLAGLGMALLGGLLVVAKRRKEKEE